MPFYSSFLFQFGVDEAAVSFDAASSDTSEPVKPAAQQPRVDIQVNVYLK